jgi:phosphoglucomutase
MSAERATKNRLTENICNIYAESFLGADHLHRIMEEAQTIVNEALAIGASPGKKEHDHA